MKTIDYKKASYDEARRIGRDWKQRGHEAEKRKQLQEENRQWIQMGRTERATVPNLTGTGFHRWIADPKGTNRMPDLEGGSVVNWIQQTYTRRYPADGIPPQFRK
jgi:hypothetical protein